MFSKFRQEIIHFSSTKSWLSVFPYHRTVQWTCQECFLADTTIKAVFLIMSPSMHEIMLMNVNWKEWTFGSPQAPKKHILDTKTMVFWYLGRNQQPQRLSISIYLRIYVVFLYIHVSTWFLSLCPVPVLYIRFTVHSKIQQPSNLFFNFIFFWSIWETKKIF